MSDENWIVGSEADLNLFHKLGKALKSCGYLMSEEWSGVGGSQEIAHWELSSPKGTLVVESETYIGLSVQGPKNLVQEIKAAFESAAC